MPCAGVRCASSATVSPTRSIRPQVSMPTVSCCCAAAPKQSPLAAARSAFVSTELLIDIGHSRIKWGWLDDAGLDRERSGRAADESAASALLNELAGSDVRRARVCASPHSPTGRTVLDALEQRGMEVDIITTGDR